MRDTDGFTLDLQVKMLSEGFVKLKDEFNLIQKNQKAYLIINIILVIVATLELFIPFIK